MPDLRAKALAALRDGRVTVVHARSHSDRLVPHELIVRVASSRPDGATYVVDLLDDGTWTCTCRDGIAGEPCAHVAAVQLITGHPSAAAKTSRSAA
jgi:SWIM zinc finger